MICRDDSRRLRLRPPPGLTKTLTLVSLDIDFCVGEVTFTQPLYPSLRSSDRYLVATGAGATADRRPWKFVRRARSLSLTNPTRIANPVKAAAESGTVANGDR